MIIAVDGPAASGKGTIARRLAERFGLAYLDTGMLYRAVGLATARGGGIAADGTVDVRQATEQARRVPEMDLDDPSLRSDEASAAASQVAALPPVRDALFKMQQTFAKEPPPLADGSPAKGAALDGRDIGTVICPQADVKLFVDAAVEVRATRRHKELIGRGLPSIYEAVLQDLVERDARDRGRMSAPLKAAEDATTLDTTEMDADTAFQAALEIVLRRNSATGGCPAS